jgi:hypothetical protein
MCASHRKAAHTSPYRDCSHLASLGHDIEDTKLGELKVDKKTATIATAAIAAMLAGVMLTGCNNTSAADGTTGGGTAGGGTISGDTTGGNTVTGDPAAAQTTTAAQTANSGPEITSPSGGGSCNAWPGVGTLQNSTISLRLAATDTESYGYEDPSDSMAVNTVLTAVADELNQLPAVWAEAIQNQVIFPGRSTDPAQIDAAASNADSLAAQLSQLCYTP